MAAVVVRPTLNKSPSLGDLEGPTSSFCEAGSPCIISPLSRNLKRSLSQDFLSLQRNDWFLSENADEMPALVTGTRKRKDDFHCQMIPQTREAEARSGHLTFQQWALGRILCMLLQRSVSKPCRCSPPFSNVTHWSVSKKAYKRPVGEEEIRSIVKHEPSNSFYVKLKESAIPKDWSNDPHHLKLGASFNGSDEQDVSESFKSEFAMPDPLPVIENHGYNQGLVLIDGGDGKYYLWHDVSDDVFELYERNLTKILSKFGQNPGFKGSKLKKLGLVGYRLPPGDSDPWKLW